MGVDKVGNLNKDILNGRWKLIIYERRVINEKRYIEKIII